MPKLHILLINLFLKNVRQVQSGHPLLHVDLPLLMAVGLRVLLLICLCMQFGHECVVVASPPPVEKPLQGTAELDVPLVEDVLIVIDAVFIIV